MSTQVNPADEPENYNLVSAGTMHHDMVRGVYEFCVVRHKQTGKFHALIRAHWSDGSKTAWAHFRGQDSEELAIQGMGAFLRRHGQEWAVSMREERGRTPSEDWESAYRRNRDRLMAKMFGVI